MHGSEKWKKLQSKLRKIDLKKKNKLMSLIRIYDLCPYIQTVCLLTWEENFSELLFALLIVGSSAAIFTQVYYVFLSLTVAA